ncbi:MAG: AMP-binding protein, partial [Clostridia bacterium]|nr:AMP-binding protein [Clostridia bacterium]
MAIRVQVPAEKRAAYEGKGYWRSRIIVEFLDEWAARQPDKALAVEHNTGRAVSRTLTYRQVQRLVRRVAAGFAALGIRKGDVVSFQLPNWWEALVVHYALASIGAVTNPLMPIFRARELRQMLGFAEARAAIVPASFRGFDHAAMFRELRAELPTLEHVFVIGGPVPEGCRSFEESFLERDWERTEWGERAAAMRPDPNDAAQLMFTSGTTGEPKGVVHTHN